MIEHLKKLERLRGIEQQERTADSPFSKTLRDLKTWQHLRLTRTYRDLAADDRYAPAATFFLNELYGAGDSAGDSAGDTVEKRVSGSVSASALRDRDLIRMVPTIKRVLPQFAFDTVEKALELDVLAEEFDQAVAKNIGSTTDQVITEEIYVAAFRAAGRRDDRLRQVELMQEVGTRLEAVVKKPFIYTTLKLLRTPSKLAGLSAMQQFLEAGFTAFRHMKGADYFLATIAARETALINRIFDGVAEPFSMIDEK